MGELARGLLSSRNHGVQFAPEQWAHLGATSPLLIIDIETRQDGLARRLAYRTDARSSTHLREVVSVSCLTRLADSSTGSWLLETFHRDSMGEEDILENVQVRLKQLALQDGTLVTFNGQAHDLPVLRLRQLRFWQCDRSAITDYLEGRQVHVDVMLEFARGGRPFTSLVDACASLGFCLNGPAGLEVDARSVSREQEKGEIDVVGTAIAFLYVAADRACSNDVLAAQLPGLGAYLKSQLHFSSHFRALANNPLLQPIEHDTPVFRSPGPAGQAPDLGRASSIAGGKP